ncbi:hypothetical protein TSUD_367320 [Trifolium subterraneum]|uniref:Uncharacterized protein n=1 Tax=Trifolium subterraneum TaxID=3900 RepID=A0A2Z6PGW1_TRISU|nr:hypothetical protein TSUD_367320 [Trifolium subterraneum]
MQNQRLHFSHTSLQLLNIFLKASMAMELIFGSLHQRASIKSIDKTTALLEYYSFVGTVLNHYIEGIELVILSVVPFLTLMTEFGAYWKDVLYSDMSAEYVISTLEGRAKKGDVLEM